VGEQSGGGEPAGAKASKGYEPEAGITASQRLRRALTLLETGRAEAARSELTLYLQQRPGSELGQDLLEQIDTPVATYFPAEYREVVSEPGQSLSAIAATYLGSPYKFHALARDNDIAEPRRLGAGRTIRIPLTNEARAAFIAQETGQETGPAGDTAAGDGGGRMRPEQVRPDAATQPAAVEPEVTLPPAEETAEPSLSMAEIEAMHREALNAYRAQNLTRAIELWDRLLAADPSYENASIYRAQAIQLQKKLNNLK